MFGNPTGISFGDPRALFDSYAQRFFIAAYATAGTSSWTYIATSKSADPRAGWWVFRVDNGVTSWAGCGSTTPCFGDYPMLGQDRYSVWLTTNQFSQLKSGSLSWVRRERACECAPCVFSPFISSPFFLSPSLSSLSRTAGRHGHVGPGQDRPAERVRVRADVLLVPGQRRVHAAADQAVPGRQGEEWVCCVRARACLSTSPLFHSHTHVCTVH